MMRCTYVPSPIIYGLVGKPRDREQPIQGLQAAAHKLEHPVGLLLAEANLNGCYAVNLGINITNMSTQALINFIHDNNVGIIWMSCCSICRLQRDYMGAFLLSIW
jgi:hypothetical protein